MKRETSLSRYHKLVEDNKKVVFPREYINYDGIKKVKYKVYIVKDIEEGDKPRVLRDKLGKLYNEKPIFGKWTVIADTDFDIEETFWMYGRNPIHDRATIHDIVKPLMSGAYQKKMVKQVIVVHNKLVIYNEDQFEMIICKCKKDAKRLHNELQKATRNNKIKSIIYMGVATPATVSRMYDVIAQHTNWPMEKIRRTSTRP